MSETRIIMVPGMACDGRVFEPQRAGGLSFESATLPMPEIGEELGAYAARIRDSLRIEGPCILGGVSFGGMIAYELAHLTQARRVLLIASCTSARAIPFRYRVTELAMRWIPDAWIERRISSGASNVITRHEQISEQQHRVLIEMARSTGVLMLRRVARMILRWKAPSSCPCPVHAIHGDRDHVIPLARVRAERVVAGAGHLVNITHAAEVNSFLLNYFD